jgi:hypothetical protein
VPVKAQDNYGIMHDVVVFRGGQSPVVEDLGWYIHIVGTPVMELMSTFLKDRKGGWPVTIAIDSEREWKCVNFGQVLKEAMIVICCGA